jgi:fructokinase
VGEATPAPTTLAIAELDAAGAADYTFYLEGTSAAQLETRDLPSGLLDDSQVVLFGGLGIVAEPIATTLRGLVAEVTEHVTVMFDVNCRRSAIRDVDAYRRTVGDYLRHVDIVKVSVDDVKLLAPDSEPRAAARDLLDGGPAAVLLTDGPHPVTIITTESERTVAVPDVAVTDSVGAGDAFVAGFLMTWSARPHRPRPLDPDELAHATSAAVLVASAACRVPGAGLPDDVVWRPAAANTGRR